MFKSAQLNKEIHNLSQYVVEQFIDIAALECDTNKNNCIHLLGLLPIQLEHYIACYYREIKKDLTRKVCFDHLNTTSRTFVSTIQNKEFANLTQTVVDKCVELVASQVHIDKAEAFVLIRETNNNFERDILDYYEKFAQVLRTANIKK